MTVVQNEATLCEKRRPGTGSSPKTAGSQSVNDNLNDNDDIMKQMRGLYARANSVLRKFAACSFEVKLRLFQAFCTSFYCAHL